MSRTHVKEKLQKDLDYAHIPMYAVIGVKPAYVCDYGVKIRVYHLLYSFWEYINVP